MPSGNCSQQPATNCIASTKGSQVGMFVCAAVAAAVVVGMFPTAWFATDPTPKRLRKKRLRWTNLILNRSRAFSSADAN
jgi:hypothetical protein